MKKLSPMDLSQAKIPLNNNWNESVNSTDASFQALFEKNRMPEQERRISVAGSRIAKWAEGKNLRL